MKEQEKELYQSAPKENKKEKSKGNPAMMKEYHYFDTKKIRSSLDLSEKAVKKGEQLCREKKVVMEDIQTGFSNMEETVLAEVSGRGEGKYPFQIQMLFARDEMIMTECHCPECRKNYYWQYGRFNQCAYVAGLLQQVEKFLQENPMGDATDKWGMQILWDFHNRQTNQRVLETMGAGEKVTLMPRLLYDRGTLSVTFKIGSQKLYVIKDLFEFYSRVQNSETAAYGSGMEISHHLDNFGEKEKEWIGFIGSVVQEEHEFERRLIKSGAPFKKSLVKTNCLELYGWRLDRFYELAEGESIYFEEKDEDGKRKSEIHCKKGNPKITMSIYKNNLEEGEIFHGVCVSCQMPEIIYGVKNGYYIQGDVLYQAKQDFLERVKPLLSQIAMDGEVDFCVGRNKLSDFYHSVLPQIRDVVDIIEEDSEEISSYLPPEAEFIFYLDAEGGNLVCRPKVRYGNQEFSMLEYLQGGNVEAFRQSGKEDEVLYLVSKWFPYLDEKKLELHCGKEEETMYQILSKGVDVLLSLGEVQCTQRFSGMKMMRKMKLSVGVSVSSGLLNLEIAADDISRRELLDVLESYRQKKKYHRLENGSFLNLEDDSLEMLGEMMDSMHFLPKDFIKGNMHLPLYRTLYLDKMLSEHESVYSERDSRFRSLVKGFKTVSDSDFEIPESLSRVMRNYQKNGYRWLKTLEAYGFGGILADDMGLGKTLQVIAVILSAKLEGKEGTALVVAPSSLVFNWGEEISRFAPGLKYALVTGTQKERRQLLEQYEQFDILVTSYDLLKRDIALYEDKQFSYQVIDEAQYIKNHTTAIAKTVKVIKSRTRYALTGTPIENRLSELWSIFDYLMPGFLYQYAVFKREIETPAVKNEDEKVMERLQKMVSPFILRRMKKQVLKDLPDKIEEARYVKLDASQQKLYNAQVVHMQQSLAGQNSQEFQKNKMQILAELTRLRQICCDPSLCFENYTGGSAKLEACLDLVQSAMEGGHKILLFSQFTTMLELLGQQLKKREVSFYTITGETPKEMRLRLVKSFNEDDTPVFLISLRAGGVGLNLTGADVVIHYDPWWNLAVQNQATDRAYRIGQEKRVTVYQLIVKNSIEEKIKHLQEKKKDLSEQVIQGKANPLGSMSQEELLELLQ